MFLFLPDEWEYRREGGLHILFAYVGRYHPIFSGKILRARKYIPDENPLKKPYFNLDQVLRYQKIFFSPFFNHPSDSLDLGILVDVPQEFVDTVMKKFVSTRPDFRRETSSDQWLSNVGVLQTDATMWNNILDPIPTPETHHKNDYKAIEVLQDQVPHHSYADSTTPNLDSVTKNATFTFKDTTDFSQNVGMDVYCVEIKPKVSLPSRSKLLHPDRRMKFLNSTQRVQQGKLGFDMTLLYSDVEVNISETLHFLFQNHLRYLHIFKNQVLVHDPRLQQPSNVDAAEWEFIRRAVTLIILERRHVLQSILLGQRLDDLDFEGSWLVLEELKKRYENIHPIFTSSFGGTFIPGDSPQAHFRNLTNQIPQSVRKKFSYDSSDEAFSTHTHQTYEQAVDEVQNVDTKYLALYLRNQSIAAAFRDCSIMVTFRQLEQNQATTENVIEVPDGSIRWAYNLKVIDLDPKMWWKIRSWYEKDISIFTNK